MIIIINKLCVVTLIKSEILEFTVRILFNEEPIIVLPCVILFKTNNELGETLNLNVYYFV